MIVYFQSKIVTTFLCFILYKLIMSLLNWILSVEWSYILRTTPINNVSVYVSKICVFQSESDVPNRQNIFLISILCFRYPINIFNIHFLFPNSYDVSKRQCFQCMFSIYIEQSESKAITYNKINAAQILFRISHAKVFG